MTSEALQASQDRGFYSLLFFAQALAEAGVRETVTVGVVVNGLHDVTGEAVFRPDRATVLGPSIVIPQEYPNVSCRTIDVVLPDDPCAGDLLADQVIAELGQPIETPVVAYRGRHRWVQSPEPVRLDDTPAPATLRARGVYVVTGGLGGIGLVIARHLATKVGARLVLIGRSVLPPRAEWASWLQDHDADDATTAKLRAILAIEESGSEVLTLSADVADREEMGRALDTARRHFGAIHGIVHAAGVAGGGIIQLKTRMGAERVLGSKLRGTAVLWEHMEGEELDFLFLCSSITAVAGGPGQVDYCGANAFLDAFARSCPTGRGARRVISVGWDAWQEVGMAVNTAVPGALSAQRARDLAHGIRPSEGVQVFDRALASGLSEIIVSTRDLRRLMDLARQAVTGPEKVREPSSADPAAAEVDAAPSGRGGLSTPFVAPTTELERTIAEVWEELLGIDKIGIQDDFFEAGGHSLLATQVMSRLYQRLGIDVPLRTLFEARTIAQFAEIADGLTRAAGADREEIEL